MLPDSYRTVSQKEDDGTAAAAGEEKDRGTTPSPHSAAYSLILSPHSVRSAGARRRHSLSSSAAAADDRVTNNDVNINSDAWHAATADSLYANKNVRYTILYNLLDGACVSVWSALLLPLLIGRRDDAASVGLCTTIGGVLQILGATLAARAAGRHHRQRVIRVAAVCGCVSIAVFLVGLPYTRVLYVAQALWGLYVGLASTATEALFADSVASGQRTGIYNTKWIVQTLCYVVGYVFALCMLVTQGNVWSLTSITRVMRMGLCCQPAAFLVLCLLRDEYALHEDDEEEEGGEYGVATAMTPSLTHVSADAHATIAAEEEVNSNNNNNNTTSHASFLIAVPDAHDTRVNVDEVYTHTTTPCDAPAARVAFTSTGDGVQTHTKEDKAATANVPAGTEEHDTFLSHFATSSQSTTQTLLHASPAPPALPWFRLLFTWSAVPYVVCAVDLLMAIGSGMVLQYFPLFFVESCHFTPVIVYVTYLTSTCTTALVASGVRAIAEHCTGRLPIVLLTRATGALALLLLAHVSTASGRAGNRDDNDSTAASVSWWPAILFVVRNSCMNAVLGLTRSVIMDAVKPENRAKWSAFESFSSFTWAGSATIGGYIAEAKGYQYTFAVTAILHLGASVLLLPAAIGAASFDAAARRLAQSAI